MAKKNKKPTTTEIVGIILGLLTIVDKIVDIALKLFNK